MSKLIAVYLALHDLFSPARWLARFLIRLTLVFGAVYATVFTVGPHEYSDWYWRPKFIETCVLGSGGRTDDGVFKTCNDAYSRRIAVVERAWKVGQIAP